MSVDHLTHLASGCERIAAVLEDTGPAVPVPSCPGWTVADLVAHHGSIHRWARAAVLEGHGRHQSPPPPRDVPALERWYRDGAAELLTTLRDVPPETPCWTLWPPAQAEFWRRRQALEAAVHRWDAETAAGADDALDPDLAADGIDEVLIGFLPRQVRLGRTPGPATSLVLTDGAAAWRVGDREPVGEVRGTASDLLLLLWGRRTHRDEGRFDVRGDQEAVAAVLALPITP